MVEELANESPGQVVGDVARDELSARGKGPRDIKAQDVGLDELHVVVCGQHVSKRGYQPRVELHRDHASAPCGKRDGQRANTRPDFQDLIAAVGSGCFGDGVAELGIDEEVLAEAVLKGDPVATQQAVQLLSVGRIDQSRLRRAQSGRPRRLTSSSGRG